MDYGYADILYCNNMQFPRVLANYWDLQMAT